MSPTYCLLYTSDAADVPAIKDALVPIVVDLVRHGLILPTELLEDKQ